MVKKYSESEKLRKREEYLKSRSGDLTSYAALIGEGFASKINLLAQIIGDAHHPSLGNYKERLLSKVISDFIPKRYEVGTGFVLFPTEKTNFESVPDNFDRLNQSDHTVSRQCDIIVYDANDFPVVFKDNDFVVVRPESVRSVVEVKGTLNNDEIDSAVSHFVDLGRKWKNCNDFYVEHHQPPLHNIGLFLMGWQAGVDKKGRPLSDGKRLRERINGAYSKLDKSQLKRFQVLENAYIYNDCEVASIVHSAHGGVFSYGFMTFNGKFIRRNKLGDFEENGDRTIASLLAGVHLSLETPFNRFFRPQSDTRQTKICPHEFHGFSKWLNQNETVLLGWKEAPERVSLRHS